MSSATISSFPAQGHLFNLPMAKQNAVQILIAFLELSEGVATSQKLSCFGIPSTIATDFSLFFNRSELDSFLTFVGFYTEQINSSSHCLRTNQKKKKKHLFHFGRTDTI